ncbi:MAG: hypothetical protein U5K43_09520 [Halofilum sp. (in: g-proteobacteria)]|nr:hypothetical protein [Halofilum sp. (in: g-proteobacteria)]
MSPAAFFTLSVVVLAALLFVPVTRLIWALSVRRLERRRRRDRRRRRAPRAAGARAPALPVPGDRLRADVQPGHPGGPRWSMSASIAA